MPRMRERSHAPGSEVRRYALWAGIALALWVAASLNWAAFRNYRDAEAKLPMIGRMEAFGLEIGRLNEILRGSAQMASTTSGDPRWEARYRRSEPRMDELIQAVSALESRVSQGEGARHLLDSDAALDQMEDDAFELVRQGKYLQARKLLSSPPHEAQAAAHAESMARFSADLMRADDVVRDRLQLELRHTAITTLASTLVLVVASWFVYIATRRWQSALVDSNRELNRKGAELEQFNQLLDAMVSERTRELSESAMASLNMMEDAIRERENTLQANGKLDFLAYYDVLTGLANRRLFLDRVTQYAHSAVSGGHNLALVLIDLERFKNFNDSLGREGGDALLKQMAQWLSSDLGDANLVARVGPDLFAVVLPDVKNEDDVARFVGKSMVALQEHPFALGGVEFRIAAKLGIAMFPDDGWDADSLFKHAEAALKKAKASGERYLFYTQKMTEMVAGKLTMETQMRQALDNEEFVLHYQPKVNLRSGRITSCEALIRWNDPRTGLVPPFKFIPILEETGLIKDVGRWALRKAIDDYLRWRDAGMFAPPIAVNVSALQLRDRGFIADIQGAIGVDVDAAAGLELEITESVIMDDVGRGIATLQAIRDMGIKIAIDDFGTGFSSLGYLSKLPVDTLKIDRSFIVAMPQSPDGLALVSTIIHLGHSLRLKLVAEGVETEEESNLLRLLKCDEMQGYIFSKPVPCDVFEEQFLVLPGPQVVTSAAMRSRVA